MVGTIPCKRGRNGFSVIPIKYGNISADWVLSDGNYKIPRKLEINFKSLMIYFLKVFLFWRSLQFLLLDFFFSGVLIHVLLVFIFYFLLFFYF